MFQHIETGQIIQSSWKLIETLKHLETGLRDPRDPLLKKSPPIHGEFMGNPLKTYGYIARKFPKKDCSSVNGIYRSIMIYQVCPEGKKIMIGNES